MLKQLTLQQIAPLAARKGAKKVAVENFLMTVHFCETYQNAVGNLEMDTAAYKWNAATRSAISAGILMAAQDDAGKK
jgi:hypothetical protein